MPELPRFDNFYTNPPWGASNEGESVTVFMERGMEATHSNCVAGQASRHCGTGEPSHAADEVKMAWMEDARGDHATTPGRIAPVMP
jgi:predicted RNA methylase